MRCLALTSIIALVLTGCEATPTSQAATRTPSFSTLGAAVSMTSAAAAYGVTNVTRSELDVCADAITGNPPQVPTRRIVPLCESDDDTPFFASGFSVSDMRSIWSAYQLTKPMIAKIEASDLERPGHFNQNAQLRALKIPQPSHEDYTNNPDAYQRGHYTPSEASKWDEAALRASFQVTNIAPQHGGMNGSLWRCYEQTIRSWAKQWGKVQVVVGGSVAAKKSIGNKRKITVPTYFYTIVYRPDTKTAIGLAVPNVAGFNLDTREYMMSVADVEEIAGIAVGLPTSVKNTQPKPKDWPVLVAQIPYYLRGSPLNECVPIN